MTGMLKIEEKAAEPTVATPGVSLARIMVATDFSSNADRALDYAASLARRFGSRLYVTHVITFAGHEMMEPDLGAPTDEALRQMAERKAKAIEDSGRLYGVPHEMVIEEGTLWPALEMLLEEHKINLLVVGTHGLSGPVKAVFGSNAEMMFRQSAVPVLTVGPGVTEEAPFEEEFRTILFATDFRPAAEREAALAYAIAQEHRSVLLLLHVTPFRPGVPHNEALLDRALITHQLQELVPQGERKCKPEYHIAYGEPVSAILRVAEEARADLIVVGATKDGALAGHWPGTTAYGVVRGAKCPVLTVKG
ncbi:MAG TPA: universal stress protein [Candidatus Acidoferrales bacterium]|nr:universal stress protein [Candidatus Acidoferrales bacterium]